tara:strand:+ start:4880 stop:6160 length:1281 start_codon:yes stop_codon:yes gene_type:complete
MSKIGTLIHGLDNSQANGTNFDATISGFGQVDAFVTFLSYHNYNSGATSNNSGESIITGVWDGSAYKVYNSGVYALDNRFSSEMKRFQNYSDDDTVYLRGFITLEAKQLTDGLRFTKTATGTVFPSYLVPSTTIIFGGVNADMIKLGSSTSGTKSFSINPNVIFGHTAGQNNSGQTESDTNIYSWGMAERSGNSQVMYAQGGTHGASTMQVSQRMESGYLVGQIHQDSQTWISSISSWGTNSVTMSTTGSTGDDDSVLLAIDDSIRAKVGVGNISLNSSETFSGPTDTGYVSQVALAHMCTAQGTGVQVTQPASTGNSYCFISNNSSGSTSSHQGTVSADGIGTSDEISYSGADLKLKAHNGSAVYDAAIGSMAFNGNDVDMTLTTVPYPNQHYFGHIVLADDQVPAITNHPIRLAGNGHPIREES